MPSLPIRSLRWRFAFWFGLFILTLAVGARAFQFRVAVELLARDIDAQLWARLGALKVQQRFAPEPLLDPTLRLGGLLLPDIRTATDWKPSGVLRAIMPTVSHTDLHEPAFPWFAGIWQHDGTTIDTLRLPPGCTWAPDWRDHTDRIWTQADGQLRLAATAGRDNTLLLVGTSLAPLHEAERQAIFFYSWTLAAASVPGLLVGWLLLTRMLKPLGGITRTAERIRQGHFNERIDVAAADSELVGMAETINSMLDRLDAIRIMQSRFNADVAHQVLSPVHGILLQTDVAMQRPRTSAELTQTVSSVRDLAGRIQSLCEALLSYSQSLAIDSTILKQVDLDPIIDAAVEQVTPLATDRGVTIINETTATLVRGQPELLRQVFVNLLANAIAHSPAGGTVSVELHDDEGRRCVLVIDHGSGVSATDAPHLFERFFRGEGTGSSVGHGLGLAICQSIMQSHGGDVVHRPTPGGGATFEVRFPAVTAPKAGAQSHSDAV
jgi:signal transduction histidine kinase